MRIPEGLAIYDIAILVLKQEVTPNNKIQIANLPKENELCPNELVVSGWGKDVTREKIAKRFLWAVKQECFHISKCPNFVGNETLALCAGDSKNELNSGCVGDSGGRQ